MARIYQYPLSNFGKPITLIMKGDSTKKLNHIESAGKETFTKYSDTIKLV